MNELKQEAKRFSKYGIVGLVNNISLYGLFLVLLYFEVSPVTAAGLCYVIGVAVSYVLNRSWTYQSTSSHRRDLPKFLVAYGVGLITTLLTIAVLVMLLPPAIAQILNVVITAIVIYIMLNFLNFGIGDRNNAD